MTTLALEFSTERRSVALARDGAGLAEAVQQTAGRETNALGLIENVLAAAGVGREEVEVIVVGLGPGSYAGIRGAIALAQGWQLARGIKLLGLSSVAAMAAQAQAEQIFGRVNVVVDAQRGEFYVAGWEISAGRREEITPLKIITAADLAALAAGAISVGPAAARVLFPTAAMLAHLAAGRTDFLRGEELTPVYLRETAFVKSMPGRVL